jgi:hypothetical protein
VVSFLVCTGTHPIFRFSTHDTHRKFDDTPLWPIHEMHLEFVTSATHHRIHFWVACYFCIVKLVKVTTLNFENNPKLASFLQHPSQVPSSHPSILHPPPIHQFTIASADEMLKFWISDEYGGIDLYAIAKKEGSNEKLYVLHFCFISCFMELSNENFSCTTYSKLRPA